MAPATDPGLSVRRLQWAPLWWQRWASFHEVQILPALDFSGFLGGAQMIFPGYRGLSPRGEAGSVVDRPLFELDTGGGRLYNMYNIP